MPNFFEASEALEVISNPTVILAAVLSAALFGGYILTRGKQYPYNDKKRRHRGWWAWG
jgi:hypothetical protein